MTTRPTRQQNAASHGVREVKAHLSTLLKEVQRGREILITDRGRPVGKLVPVGAQDLTLSARLEHLTRLGWLEPEPASSAALPPPLPMTGSVAQKMLREDRDR
ncbi:MAG: type II toxin-antitoxin system Phd/YefM family antitoxin [Candidatus Xenobia bacterium]